MCHSIPTSVFYVCRHLLNSYISTSIKILTCVFHSPSTSPALCAFCRSTFVSSIHYGASQSFQSLHYRLHDPRSCDTFHVKLADCNTTHIIGKTHSARWEILYKHVSAAALLCYYDCYVFYVEVSRLLLFSYQVKVL